MRQSPTAPTDRELRAAKVAIVLARGVRDTDVVPADALRILRHELRRRTTNRAIKMPLRSKQAQRVIDEYGTPGPPKNGSDDALRADHLWPLTEETLQTTTSVEAWVDELRRLSQVAVVTTRLQTAQGGARYRICLVATVLVYFVRPGQQLFGTTVS
jgi:hypothetical protein